MPRSIWSAPRQLVAQALTPTLPNIVGRGRRSARDGELADGLYLLHETVLANHQTTTHASILNPKGELDASHA